MSSPPRLSLALGIFVGGAACGAAAVLIALRQPPAAPRPEPAPLTAAQPDVATPAPRGAVAVTVTFSRGNEDLRRRGTLLADAGVLLVGIEPFGAFQSASWRDLRGVRHALDRVVAWDFDLGIAAFAVDDSGYGATLAADDGSLYVGLDIEMADGAGVERASVATTATRMAPGFYVYGVALGAPPRPGSPLLLPGTRTLAGMVIRPVTDSATHSALAVDAGALRDLLAAGERTAAVSLSGLGALWRESRHGLRSALAEDLAAERWQEAVQIAETLRQQYPDALDERLNAAALRAIAELAGERLGARQPGAALSLLRNAARDWTPNPEFMLLVARAQAGANQPGAAIETLREARASAAGSSFEAVLRDELRQLIERYADDPTLPENEAIALLRDALNGDDYAGYHRALGLRLFEAGSYAAAAFHLQRAIELQPALAGQLRYALDQSLQRRSTTGLIEVPLENAGNSLFVNVRLNDSRESFRFLLDTGASYSAVNTRTVLRLGLSDIFANGAVPIRLETAAGPVYAGSFTMQRVDVAGAIVHNVPVVILEDLNSVDGLLGLSFLNHFGVQINQQEGKLLLTPR